MYEVELSEHAQRFLNKLDKHIKDMVEERLRKLKVIPIPSDAKFIGRDDLNNKIFRYRIGDFRALYKVKETEHSVLIAKIDKRPRVYDR